VQADHVELRCRGGQSALTVQRHLARRQGNAAECCGGRGEECEHDE
jgi:hypothetical protein